MSSSSVRSYALLIGVSDYSLLDSSADRAQGTSDLPGAHNDVASMAMLTRMAGIPAENIRVLTSPGSGPNDFAAVALGRTPPQNMGMADASFGYATRAGILEGLDWLATQLRQPHTQGVIYFSGHSIIGEQGHLCLCPADTRQGVPPIAPLEDAAHPDAMRLYIWRAVLLCALDEVAGTSDPAVLARLVTRLCADMGGVRRTRRWVAEAARAEGLEPRPRGLRKFAEDIANTGGDGDSSQAILRDRLSMLPHLGLTEAVIDRVLHHDPLADGDSLRGLISFGKAFYQLLRDVPEENPVHILLETCMEEAPGRTLHPHYRSAGVPLAHGNIVLLGSCGLGQASNLAVFDNRWHGAFTWALVSLLSQTPVQIADEGRSFAVTYGVLGERIQALLGLMGFAQAPALWSQPAQAGWEVLGTLPGTWTVHETLLPIRVREEVSAGSTGRVFEIVAAAGDPLGWLVALKESVTVGGQTWEGARDYWVWSEPRTALPAGTFRLVRPAGSPPGSGSIGDWLAQIGWHPDRVWVYQSGAFTGNANNSANLGVHYRVRYLLSGQPQGVLCAVTASGTQLSWHRFAGAAVDGQNRLLLGSSSNVLLSAGEAIVFEQLPPQSGVTYVGSVLVESPI